MLISKLSLYMCSPACLREIGWDTGNESSEVLLSVIDLLVAAVLAGPGGQRIVVADRAGQVVHQTQLPLH